MLLLKLIFAALSIAAILICCFILWHEYDGKDFHDSDFFGE